MLPEIQSSLRRALEIKQQYQWAEGAVESVTQRVTLSGGMIVDRQEFLKQRAFRDHLAEKLKSLIEEILGYGCLVKDLDIGLIDFPTLFRGREVYLCWKLGEPGISFWHGTDEGFAGRKPIDSDFLDNHRGDAPN